MTYVLQIKKSGTYLFIKQILDTHFPISYILTFLSDAILFDKKEFSLQSKSM